MKNGGLNGLAFHDKQMISKIQQNDQRQIRKQYKSHPTNHVLKPVGPNGTVITMV